MARHILLKIAHHSIQSLVVDGNVVRVHPEHLFPPFAPGVFQIQLDIGESLVDLPVDLLVEIARFRVPAACCACWLLGAVLAMWVVVFAVTYLDLRIRCDRRRVPPGCSGSSFVASPRHRGMRSIGDGTCWRVCVSNVLCVKLSCSDCKCAFVIEAGAIYSMTWRCPSPFCFLQQITWSENDRLQQLLSPL